jgi:hypothetical protein
MRLSTNVILLLSSEFSFTSRFAEMRRKRKLCVARLRTREGERKRKRNDRKVKK